MSLNIKNEGVHALAREAAARTGRSQTSVIELALQRLLDELDQQQRVDNLGELIEELQRDVRGRLTSDDLYDDAGLPR